MIIHDDFQLNVAAPSRMVYDRNPEGGASNTAVSAATVDAISAWKERQRLKAVADGDVDSKVASHRITTNKLALGHACLHS